MKQSSHWSSGPLQPCGAIDYHVGPRGGSSAATRKWPSSSSSHSRADTEFDQHLAPYTQCVSVNDFPFASVSAKSSVVVNTPHPSSCCHSVPPPQYAVCWSSTATCMSCPVESAPLPCPSAYQRQHSCDCRLPSPPPHVAPLPPQCAVCCSSTSTCMTTSLLLSQHTRLCICQHQQHCRTPPPTTTSCWRSFAQCVGAALTNLYEFLEVVMDLGQMPNSSSNPSPSM
jgi:hypothetical protein